MGLVEFGWPELRMGRRSMERGGRGKLGRGGLMGLRRGLA